MAKNSRLHCRNITFVAVFAHSETILSSRYFTSYGHTLTPHQTLMTLINPLFHLTFKSNIKKKRSFHYHCINKVFEHNLIPLWFGSFSIHIHFRNYGMRIWWIWSKCFGERSDFLSCLSTWNTLCWKNWRHEPADWATLHHENIFIRCCEH